ncbi:unnamed protein product [Peniophora sp. CBMAI 1063]|nr:unnamed protein product [Peniophora sp. CBMAI 1063]
MMDRTARLPPETLTHIFHSVRRLSRIPPLGETFWNRRASNSESLYFLGWLVVTHVCARWRTFALSDATLWVDIPLALGQQWTSAFLSRSKQAPISVDWSFAELRPFDSKYEERFFDLLMAHYPRMRELDVRYAETVPFIQNGAWPTLETARLIFSEGHHTTLDLFNGHAPLLRSLSLHTRLQLHQFNWASPILHNLNSLDIQFDWAVDAQSMPSFLDALSGMPRLRDLRLVDWSVRGESPPISPCMACSTSRTVTAALETFVCKTTLNTMCHAMNHIICPPTVRFLLDLGPYYAEDIDQLAELVPILCPLLSNWYQALPRPNPFVAACILVEPECARLSASRSLHNMDGMGATSSWVSDIHNIEADLNLALPMDLADWASPMVDIVRSLMPSTLRVLTFDFGSEYLLDELRLSDTLFKGVEVLRLRDATALPEIHRHFPKLSVLEVQEPQLRNIVYRWDDITGVLNGRGDLRPIRFLYLHVAEEVESVRRGEISRTSCNALPPRISQDEIKSVIDEMEAVPEIRVVTENEGIDYEAILECCREAQ